MNQLFYGDNLAVLRRSIADDSVDLIYLDPPFNSNADYNALFKTPKGAQSVAQMAAFTDTWQWDDAISGQAVVIPAAARGPFWQSTEQHSTASDWRKCPMSGYSRRPDRPRPSSRPAARGRTFPAGGRCCSLR